MAIPCQLKMICKKRNFKFGKFTKFESLHIDRKQWHQLRNETDNPLRIIEIQYGENCIEDDIERI